MTVLQYMLFSLCLVDREDRRIIAPLTHLTGRDKKNQMINKKEALTQQTRS